MRVLCLDTETTRLPVGTRQPEIVQIGMVSWNTDMGPDGEWKRELCALVNPDVPLDQWDPESVEIHGIGPEDVEGEPTLPGLMREIFDVAVGCELLIGYNLPFDVGVLAAELRRHDIEHHFPWPLAHVDVQDLAMEAMPLVGRSGRKPPKLVEIYEHLFGSAFDGAHDAMADVKATIKVWDRLL